MPKRIQRQRTKGWRLPENTRCVTRPGFFGNPFVGDNADGWYRKWLSNPVSTAAEVAACAAACGQTLTIHESYSPSQKANTILAVLHKLKGFDLACSCRLDKRCHADVLIELANSG